MTSHRNAMLLALLIATASAVVSDAQAPVRDQPIVVPVGTASLAGTVVDEHSTPIRRASVSITGDMRLSRTMTTDDAGRFRFAELPAGRFTITAEKPAY